MMRPGHTRLNREHRWFLGSLIILTMIIISTILFLTPAFASNHPTIKVSPPQDEPRPPQFWGTYYYDICAGSEPLNNPTINVVTDLNGLTVTSAYVNLEPYACTFLSQYLMAKDPNSLKIGFPEIPQLTVKVESIRSTGNPDSYSYFLLMCNRDERVTFDVTFTTDMETSKIEYDSGVTANGCASYGINLNATDKNSFTAQVSIPKLKEKPPSYKESTIKIPSTLVKELGLSYNFPYLICMGEKKLDDSVTFTTDVDAQELVGYTRGGSPFDCKADSINMKAKDPKSIIVRFTNMTTQMEFEKGELQTAIKQDVRNRLSELSEQYEGKRNVTVTSFNNLYQTWDGKLPKNVGSSEITSICCFTVIWYNDDRDGNTVTSTKGIFDSGPIKLDETFSYTFSKPDLYPYYSKLYPEIKHAVRVYDPLTNYQMDGGYGGVNKSICQEFGEVDNTGTCISGQALRDAVESEFQRRDNVIEERRTDLHEKMNQKELLQSQIELIDPELLKLDKKRYDIEESEYMKQYSEIIKKIEPLETEKSKLEDEIRDLEQDTNVRHICTKSETGFFTCITQTKSTNQEWEDLDKPSNSIIPQIEQSQDTILVSTDKSSYNLRDTVTTELFLSSVSSAQNIAISVTDPTGNNFVSRSVTTDSNGNAELQFRIPESAKSGTYQVIVTSSVDGTSYQESTQFMVRSQFDTSIVSVQATDQQGNPVSAFSRGTNGFVKVVLSAESNTQSLITVNLFDSELTSLGIGSFKITLSPGQSEIILSFFIPNDAVVGSADVYANAFSDWPSNGGTPLTREFSSSVEIR